MAKSNVSMILPMLAVADTKLPAGTWVAQEKYDGFRFCIEVHNGRVTGWTRHGKIRNDLIAPHLQAELECFPNCVLDGELVVSANGGYSSDVAALVNRGKLMYIAFDLLRVGDMDAISQKQMTRREALRELFRRVFDLHPEFKFVGLAWEEPISSWREAEVKAGEVWARGGEGLILKDVNARYEPGKRRRSFLKLKQVQPAVLRIIGFAPSEGEVMNYGQYGTAVLQDEDGVIVPVKVLDDETRARLKKDENVPQSEWQWGTERLRGGTKVVFHQSHPWVGRKLHIEFQIRTPDGSYRHPRWDRLDGE